MKTEDNERSRPIRTSTARSRELGEELRRVRRAAGLSSKFVAGALGWSLGKLSKLETGSRGAIAWDIAALLGRCGADKATRDRLRASTAEQDTGTFVRLHDRSPDTLAALAVHESVAATVTAYGPLVIPSLAQTEDYARALTGDSVLAAVRVERQRAAWSGRLRTAFYVHEAALRLTVGSRKVMREQVLHLILMGDSARTTVRVVPSAGRYGVVLCTPVTLLAFPEPIPPLVYVETDTATVFHKDPQGAAYERRMRHLDAEALDVEDSRRVLDRWADAYARRAADITVAR